MSDKKPFDKEISIEKLEARDIMMPRSMIKYLLKPFTKEDALDKFEKTGVIFLPVCDNSLDYIVGVCSLVEIAKNTNTLISNKYKVAFLAENQRFFEVVNVLSQPDTPIGIVVDEFGGCCGLVSKESIVAFFSSFNVSGSESVNRFTQIISDSVFGEIKSGTIGGFIMEYLGKIPKEGDTFVINNHQFTILEMNKNTIKSIAVWAMKEK